MSGVLAMILAGGEGKRLHPLTSVRTKPAVPFGGNYRIIDFALSNFINSGFLKIFVLTQIKISFADAASPGRLEVIRTPGALHRSDTGANADGETMV